MQKKLITYLPTLFLSDRYRKQTIFFRPYVKSKSIKSHFYSQKITLTGKQTMITFLQLYYNFALVFDFNMVTL